RCPLVSGAAGAPRQRSGRVQIVTAGDALARDRSRPAQEVAAVVLIGRTAAQMPPWLQESSLRPRSGAGSFQVIEIDLSDHVQSWRTVKGTQAGVEQPGKRRLCAGQFQKIASHPTHYTMLSLKPCCA
ncbi:hypothetical protein BSV11_20315, partial [Salmonella enterica subsp. enterica serovar Enteritidis]